MLVRIHSIRNDRKKNMPHTYKRILAQTLGPSYTNQGPNTRTSRTSPHATEPISLMNSAPKTNSVQGCAKELRPWSWICVVSMKWALNLMYISRDMTKRTKQVYAKRRLRSAWASAWRKLGSLATHWADSEDSDQTGRMPTLTRVFAGRTVTLLDLSCRGSY